jgi:hypothetical protein
VHSPALLALKRRRREIEQYLAEEAHRRRQQVTTAPEVSGSAVTFTVMDIFNHVLHLIQWNIVKSKRQFWSLLVQVQ